MATEDDILRVHSIEHIENIKLLSANGGGETGILTVVGNGSFEIAMLSAGGLLALVDAIMAGEVDNGYALVRPPGHHATRDQAEGFCIFCNSAIAAAILWMNITLTEWRLLIGMFIMAMAQKKPFGMTIRL